MTPIAASRPPEMGRRTNEEPGLARPQPCEVVAKPNKPHRRRRSCVRMSERALSNCVSDHGVAPDGMLNLCRSLLLCTGQAHTALPATPLSASPPSSFAWACACTTKLPPFVRCVATEMPNIENQEKRDMYRDPLCLGSVYDGAKPQLKAQL